MRCGFLFIFFTLIYDFSSSAQLLDTQTLCSLGSFAVETSGIENADSISYWTHNDGGGRPVLYRFNSSGLLLDTLIISNVKNIDWEDLARDDSGNIYIGDFGNNFNDRTNLRIIKLNHDSILYSSGKTSAEIISFKYPDQAALPPSNSNLNFDCEAFIHSGDSLYLFTKNISTSKNSGYTKQYRIPDTGGSFTADLVDSFYLNEPVTSADILGQDTSLVLLTYFSVFLFHGFRSNDFFSVAPKQFQFRSLTQKEAVLFKDSSHLLITDEKVFGTGGKLYLIDLTSGVLKSSCRKKFYSISHSSHKCIYNQLLIFIRRKSLHRHHRQIRNRNNAVKRFDASDKNSK